MISDFEKLDFKNDALAGVRANYFNAKCSPQIEKTDIIIDNRPCTLAYSMRAGEPLSWGLSKKGYCAIIDGRVTIGMAENSPLFEQATEQGGYFFRQYPSVANGVMVENRPENASFRRALCNFNGRLCIIGCTDRRADE